MNTTSTITPDAARAAMVTRLRATRPILDSRVADVMRRVPRDRFVPGASIDDAYADRAVITKKAAGGAPLSCASEPRIVAMMLDQLAVPAGARVLEIGAGTGYNAALLAELAELAGPSGQVTTIDIDPDVTAGARSALHATGYGDVQVITGDGGSGYAPHAPYDRIIVTVGPWDIPPAWTQQLAADGRLVVPLRWRGQARSIAFARAGDGTLVSDSVELCGFIPMTGPGQHGEHRISLAPGGQVTIHHDADQPVTPGTALSEPPETVWSGVTVGPEDSFDGVWLRLAATEPATCRIDASGAAAETGVCRPAIPARSPALVQNGSLAYLTLRRLDTTPPRFELGATGHGPNGLELAGRICAQIQAWGNDPGAQPTITLHPADADPRPGLPGRAVKGWTHLTTSF